MILLRTLKYTPSVTDTQLFVHLNHRHEFDLPGAVPDRFVPRAVQVNVRCYNVDSIAYETTTMSNLHSLQLNGIWITRDDSVPRGKTVPSVFGIPLTDRAVLALQGLPQSTVRVGYHGTSYEAWKSIQKQNLLKPSIGQLGTGTYIGSFWKATRFALRDQAYEWRPSNAVFRVLWICNALDSYPKDRHWCTCVTYCSTKIKEKASACDHLRDWTAKDEQFNGAELRIGQYTDGTWITQNEEWVVNPASILRLAEAVQVQQESACQTRYDPHQRNYKLV